MSKTNSASNRKAITKLVTTAILLALVILLQTVGSGIKLGAVSISLVLIPIVIAGIFVGKAGASFIGFVFGLIVLIAGIIGADGFTHILFENNPVITTLICTVKGTAAGFVSAWLYEIISKRNKYAAVFVASAAAPIVNTGLFIIGSLFLKDTISAKFVAEGTTFFYFLFIGCAGFNFIAELIVNMIFAPAVYRISQAFKK
ncbi:MAG: ECF transporter S component [Clostridia bacterium]|nr:ECF transporter S component [Clostridia bacterium]